MLRAQRHQAAGIGLCILALCCLRVKAGQTAYVSSSPNDLNSTSFLTAVQDQHITNIVLLNDISVGDSFNPYVGTGLPITRNVTVTGVDGVNTILNLNFVHSAVKLCSTCLWTFENVTVENDRRGTGGLIDFFLGELGSRVLMNSVYRLRPACTAAADTAVVVNATERSKYWPNPKGPQLFSYRDVEFKGQSFPKSFYLTDFSTDDPSRVQEGRGAMGGYAVRNINTTRLCRYTVDPECLTRKASDACVNDLVDQVLAGDMAGAGSPGRPTNTAAVAAGVAVAAAVVLAAVLGLLLWRRRRARRREQLPLHKPSAAYSRRYSGSEANVPGMLISHPESGGGGYTGPSSDVRGWEVSNMLTTPLIQGDPQDVSMIQFGELLGAGSFGRVYKATWAGREVAVKVIEHDSGSSPAVENEVELMLSFNHPNIVRAFHCVTYTRTGASTRVATSGGGTRTTDQGSGSAGTSSLRDMGSSNRQQPDCSSSLDSAGQLQTSSKSGGITPSAALPPAAAVMNDSAASVQPHKDSPAPGSAAAATAVVPAADAELSVGSPMAGSKTAVDRLKADKGVGLGSNTADVTAGVWGVGGSGGGWGVSGNSLGVVTGSSKTQRAETWLVQEYCDCGTLGGIVGEWEPSEENEQRMLLRLLLLQDCAQGLKVLHSRHVVHGDLNARNVLVSSSATSPTGLCGKLADLGLSRVIKQQKTHRTTNTVGTMSHMPPELLRYGRMSAAVDIYAFGIMMWEVFTGQPAFKKLHYGQFFETIVMRNLRPMIPAGMPADYQLLMEHCWATDPADRPSIDRVLECLRYMIQERQHSSPVCSAPASSAPAQPSLADRVPSLLIHQPQERLTRFRAGPSNPSSPQSLSPNRMSPGACDGYDVTQGSAVGAEDFGGTWGTYSEQGFGSRDLGFRRSSGDPAGFSTCTGTKVASILSEGAQKYSDGDADMVNRYESVQAGKGVAGPVGARYGVVRSYSKDAGPGLQDTAQGSDEFNSSNRWFV